MRHFWGRLFRVVKIAGQAGLALLIVGIVYEIYAAHRDKMGYPPPGAFVNVEGRKVYVDCIGRGSATVVLESGLGGPTVLWGQIQPKLAESTRVCSYDRDGIGWSDESHLARSAGRFASDPHTALHDAGEAARM